MNSHLQNLRAEIDIHQAQKDALAQQGEDMIANEHPESEVVRERINELEQSWDNMKDLSDKYQTQLDVSAQAKQVGVIALGFVFCLLPSSKPAGTTRPNERQIT
jgi:prefoldin subunit 5